MPDLACSPNAATAFDFLVGKGLRDFQAAAVVGNLQQESPGLNPKLAVMDTNRKMSRGIAMWQPDRWDNLLAFAAGRDPLALDTQLDFLWHELPTNGLSRLLETSTLEDAVVAFQNQFERPLASAAHTDRRIAYAKSALFACPAVRPPEPTAISKKKIGFWVPFATVLAIAAGGYGAYKLLESKEPRAPRFPPPERHPEFDYRSRL